MSHRLDYTHARVRPSVLSFVRVRRRDRRVGDSWTGHSCRFSFFLQSVSTGLGSSSSRVPLSLSTGPILSASGGRAPQSGNGNGWRVAGLYGFLRDGEGELERERGESVRVTAYKFTAQSLRVTAYM